MSGLDNWVPLRTLPKTIAAAQYNRVRLALRRLGKPLRLEMPRLRVEIVLDDRVWLCHRPLSSELPVLAWTDFEARGRALHEPVHCVVHLYHFHAGLLMGVALDGLDSVLVERLSGVRPHA